MRKILKRPLARNDIKGIWRYTFEQWSETQADRYIKSLEEALIKLAQNPSLGSTAMHPQADLLPISQIIPA